MTSARALAPKRRCFCGQFQPCPNHKPGRRSRQAQEWHGLYDARWRRYRLAFLAEHPLCVDPHGLHPGDLVPATIVGHKVAHRGDIEKFWDDSNHEAVCLQCNSYQAATVEGGFGNAPRK